MEQPRRPQPKRSYAETNMDDDELSDGSEWRPSAKKGKLRMPPFPRDVFASDPVEGSSGEQRRRRDEAAAARAVERRLGTESESYVGGGQKKRRMQLSITESSSAQKPPGVNAGRIAVAEVEKLKEQNQQLIAQLATQEQQAGQNMLQARQDHILALELVKQKLDALSAKQVRVTHHLDRMSGDLTRVTADLSKEKTIVKQKEVEAKAFRAQLDHSRHTVAQLKYELALSQQEVEHQTAINNTAEDDLRELREIENDDRAHRARKKEHRQTLPPAYGSLDEDDPANDAEEAVDSGALDVANFKRNNRNTFMRSLAHAQHTNEGLRSLPGRTIADSQRADAELIVALMQALSAVAQNVKDVLNRSKDIFFDRLRVVGNMPRHVSVQRTKERALSYYIGDRLAKLLLDIIVRVIAALELRIDLQISFTNRQGMEIDLAWTRTDQSLQLALIATFTSAGAVESQTEKLFNLQYYLSHTRMLEDKLANLGLAAEAKARRTGGHAQPGNVLLVESILWLEEQEEKIRVMASEERAGAGQVPVSEDVDDEDNEDDEDDEDDEAGAAGTARDLRLLERAGLYPLFNQSEARTITVETPPHPPSLGGYPAGIAYQAHFMAQNSLHMPAPYPGYPPTMGFTQHNAALPPFAWAPPPSMPTTAQQWYTPALHYTMQSAPQQPTYIPYGACQTTSATQPPIYPAYLASNTATGAYQILGQLAPNGYHYNDPPQYMSGSGPEGSEVSSIPEPAADEDSDSEEEMEIEVKRLEDDADFTAE